MRIPDSAVKPSDYLWRLTYTGLVCLLLPWALWRLARRHGWRAVPWREYWGFCPPPAAAEDDSPVVWIHTVSVGEAVAAAPLTRWLRERGCSPYLTCTTLAAREWLKRRHPDAVVAALPLDFPFAVRRFFRRCRPRLGVVLEAEYWPNLLFAGEAAGVRLLLANARLSRRSARRYRRAAPLLRASLRRFDGILAQTQRDAGRLRCYVGRSVPCAGNLKFDVVGEAVERRRMSSKFCFLFAATRAGEEARLLAATDEAFWRENFVLLAPRHPHRLKEVVGLLDQYRLRYAVRSRREAVAEDTQVYVADTLGEMNRWYASCDFAVIGGSFVDYGGQNPIEAMRAGTPAVVGPYVANYARLVRRAAADGALLRATDATAALAAGRLSEAERRRMGERAAAFCQAQGGALAAHKTLAEFLLKFPKGRTGVDGDAPAVFGADERGYG